ncbi:MAG TPA: ABC transporter ATP-binding protein [Xanthobacteraceae bacterium]|nr:ABC transporter ATP-binding protein [Xanthobacteraceae bacterium]
MSSVRLDSLRKQFGATVAVNDVSVEFRDGEMTSVLGPSGCGKTTMLNLVAGFIEPDRGSIHFGERVVADAARGLAVPSNKRDIGMVFQSYALWPHLTVADNVGYGLKMRKIPRPAREQAVRHALERVRLEQFLQRFPHQLSGGQQQRVALARAIAYAPQILLFDEPLSNLDANLREEMRLEIKSIQREIGITSVYVTHDQAEAMALSDRIVVMGDGQALQVGTPRELYAEPADVRVARFLGRTNLFSACIVEASAPLAKVRIDGLYAPVACRAPTNSAPPARGWLSVRPEGILVQPPDVPAAGFPGRISATIYLGGTSQLHIALAMGKTVEVQTAAQSTWRVGDAVKVAFDPQQCYFIGERPTKAAPGSTA